MVKGLPGDEGSCLQVCAGVLLGLFLLCTLVLTPTALFTNHWACKVQTVDHSTWYSHYTTTRTKCNGVDGAALIFVYIAFIFMFLPIKCVCCICCTDEGCAGYLALVMICYSISAVFSFIGCLIHAGQFATSELGYSFYLGLIPGLLFLLLILLVILMFAAAENNWECKNCCDSDCTCCKETVRINPSCSANPGQSAEQPSENNRQVSGGEHNDGRVFTITPSYGQVSGQPPAYTEVPGFKNKIKKPI